MSPSYCYTLYFSFYIDANDFSNKQITPKPQYIYSAIFLLLLFLYDLNRYYLTCIIVIIIVVVVIFYFSLTVNKTSRLRT